MNLPNVCYSFEQTLWLPKFSVVFLCKSSTDCSGSVALKLNDGLVHEYKNENSLQSFNSLRDNLGVLSLQFQSRAKIAKNAS